MTRPHRPDIPWGREDRAAICRPDGGPCDVTRKGVCDRWDKEHIPTDTTKGGNPDA